MKARIVITDPKRTQSPPLVPTLVVDNEGVLAVCGDGWARPLNCDSLEAVTAEDVRTVLRLPGGMELHLSSPNLLSEASLKWAQAWWAAEADELRKEPVGASAS